MSQTLKLSLKRQWFDLMISGKKKHEFRCAGKWIHSRLHDKNYDLIRFTNGYGADRPYFVCAYNGYRIAEAEETHTYGDIIVTVKVGDYVIELGDITETGNLENL